MKEVGTMVRHVVREPFVKIEILPPRSYGRNIKSECEGPDFQK